MLSLFLRAHSEEAFTIDELSKRLLEDVGAEAAPGKSTIYRIMPSLVEEGLVKRFVNGHSRQFLYQGVSSEQCNRHMHLKCSVCGKVYHVDAQVNEQLKAQIMQQHHFTVDEKSTVLFGCCEKCKG